MTAPVSQETSLFARPQHVDDPASCYFYHTTDLPGFGTVSGDWDLRAGIDAYLGGVAWDGKRVLDIGAASGFLSFEMERRGADIVSYDLAETDSWDVVPFASIDAGARDAQLRSHLSAIRRSYWLTHRLRGSRARLAEGTVYRIPVALGPVDCTVFGSVLLHLRDPFAALREGLRFTRETVVVAELLPRRYRLMRWIGTRFGLPAFLVPRAADTSQFGTWWILPPQTLCEMLRILGFADLTVTYHRQFFRGGERQTYTVVGRRTSPAPAGM